MLEFLEEEDVIVEWLVGENLTREWARDLFSETVEACLRRGSPPAAPRSYFLAALKKRLKRYLRDEKARLARTEPLLADPPASDPTPLERLWERDLRELTEAILAELPPRPAEVARLRLDGWKFTSIRQV